MLPVRVAIGLLLCLSTTVVSSDWLSDNFIDSSDGYLDMSGWLATRQGFLPVPIIITEPAVGYGAGLALAFFHGEFSGRQVESPLSPGGVRRVAPSMSALAAAKTENGTWFAGGGHYGIWKDDRVRYLGAVGGGSVNMSFYGIDAGEWLDSRSIEFNTEALFLLQRISFRLADSPLFAGIGYSLVDTQNRFDLPRLLPIPGINSIEFDIAWGPEETAFYIQVGSAWAR